MNIINTDDSAMTEVTLFKTHYEIFDDRFYFEMSVRISSPVMLKMINLKCMVHFMFCQIVQSKHRYRCRYRVFRVESIRIIYCLPKKVIL